MARVLVKIENMWYDQLASISNYYEIDIETRILDHAATTFKGYFVEKFKKIIYDDKGQSASADLVLIREDYSNWYIVEVELYKHGKTHPEKQIDVFRDGRYKSSEFVPYLRSANANLDEQRLKDLIDNVQPEVLVIVDGQGASWIEDFRRKPKVIVCIFEVYKNTNGIELFRLKGDYPYIKLSETHLKQHPSFIYEILDPRFIDIPHNDELEVFYNNQKMSAKMMEAKGKKYLIIKNSLIPPRKDLVIFKDINDKYVIKLN